jgi:hypothetical protein
MNSIHAKLILWVLLFTLTSYSVPTNAKSAIAEASAAKQFLGLIFYEAQDASLTALSSAIAAFNKSSKKKITVYKVKQNNPSEKEIVDKYGIKPGNLPLVLVIAPNGVVTGGHPSNVSSEQLKVSVNVSDLMLKVLKPLQEQKVALVALQNQSTKFNAESWQGVNEFANDPQYKQFVEAVKADPLSAGSLDFVKQCQLMVPVTQATVVILMPPGRIGKILTGKLTKADVLAALGACATGCAPGGACSDRRFKQNIAAIDSALYKVTKLQGVTFSWNKKDYPRRFFTDETQMGLIAQDVEAVIPEVVLTDKEGFKSVAYDKLTAVLIEAVKEMKQRMNYQDSIIKVQDVRIKALEAKK